MRVTLTSAWLMASCQVRETKLMAGLSSEPQALSAPRPANPGATCWGLGRAPSRRGCRRGLLIHGLLIHGLMQPLSSAEQGLGSLPTGQCWAQYWPY